jgi:hypothetical protein
MTPSLQKLAASMLASIGYPSIHSEHRTITRSPRLEPARGSTPRIGWVVSMFVVFSASALSACVPSIPVNPPHDYIGLSAGGLMTPGLEIFIDLQTGLVIVHAQAAHSQNWHKFKKQLTAEQLNSLKETIRRDAREGLRSKECEEQDRLAKERGEGNPRAGWFTGEDDSMTSLDFKLGGLTGGEPERPCESAAFNDLWEAVYHASE